MNIYNTVLEGFILRVGDIINNSYFIGELNRWRKIQNLTEEDLSKVQHVKLRNILEYAHKKVSYYKSLDFVPDDDPYSFIKQFPIMRKEDIKSNLNLLLTKPKDELIAYSSSGSSGIQGTVYMSKLEQSIIRAIQVLWWEWAGYKIGMPMVQTGITPSRGVLKSIKDIIFRTKYISAFNHSIPRIEGLMRTLGGTKHYFYGGYASSLYSIAEVADLKRIDNVKFASAVSWGDKLFPHYRKKIKDVFGTEVYDTYACNEGIMIAAQNDLPYYYILSPHVFLEIVDDDGNEIKDGELGHVVVTRLDNFSMPLIRYYLGDLAIKLPREKYPPERKFQFPLLEKIIGRDTDIVKTASGKYMVVHFFTGIFEFIPEIKQFKVIQRSLKEIEIQYIPGHNFNQDLLNKLRETIHGHLDEKFPINFVEVKSISPTKSGKPQIIQSYLQ